MKEPVTWPCGCVSTYGPGHTHTKMCGPHRGWLCNKCNAGIGLLGDDIDGVLRAVTYLNKADLT